MLFLNADIRAGRSTDAKRAFALGVMELAIDSCGIKEPNMKVVFTEYEGPHFMGYDRVGSAWSASEGTAE